MMMSRSHQKPSDKMDPPITSESVDTIDETAKQRVLRELARRSLPSDMAGTLCLAFSFVNLSVSFCLVNLNSAQGEPEPGEPPTPIHTNAEKYYKIMVDSTSIAFALYMYLNRAKLCDQSRRRRVNNFKLKALNFLSLGAVVNNLTCVCILFATEKEHISGVNITVHVTDLLFYVAMVSFMNLMNRESFHENPLVRFMIGWIMITLVTQWFVIFFESKEVCAELLNQKDMTDEEFKSRQYMVQTLEDITYVMKTEGTIFIFEWMFVLYGSFRIREPYTDEQLVGQNIDTYEKIGVQVPWSKRMCWHTFFAGYQTTRIAIMVVQVIRRTKPWAYLTMAMSLMNTWFGLVCLGVISWFSIRKPEKAIPDRRSVSDEDDSLMNYSSFAVYLNIMYHLIVGTYYAIFWNDKSGIECAAMMNGTFQAAELPVEEESVERVRRSGGEEEGGGKPMADATPNDVLAMSVLYIFYYSGEIILVAFQTVIIMYLRRSRIVLGLPNLKFWIFGLMYYNCSDWISIAWIAEENPGIRPMDACANFLSKGVIHLLLTIVLFYRFTAWRLLNRSVSRAIDEEDSEDD